MTSGSISYGPWEQEYTKNYLQIALQVPVHSVAKIEKHRVTFYVYGVTCSIRTCTLNGKHIFVICTVLFGSQPQSTNFEQNFDEVAALYWLHV